MSTKQNKSTPAKPADKPVAQAAAPERAPDSATSVAPATATNPFARSQADHINAGTVAIEAERAIAEAQGKLVIAKRFPRDPFRAFNQAMEACRRPTFADEALYKYSRGDGPISGPSIRLAEELARCWQNIEYGLRELSNKNGVSEMEAYAWDLETNTYSSQKFTVRHWRDTRGGGYELRDQRDIYELTANLGARRMRARILAILPGDLVDAAVAECYATIAGKNDEPMTVRLQRVVAKFSRLGVSVPMIEAYLKHPLADTVPTELADLQAVYNAIKDDNGKVSDYFGITGAVTGATISADGTKRPRGLQAVVDAATPATSAPGAATVTAQTSAPQMAGMGDAPPAGHPAAESPPDDAGPAGEAI